MGIDDYTGDYQADYIQSSATEFLFGGTSIMRKAGREISVTCTLSVTSGKAKIFLLSGSDTPFILMDTNGTSSETLTLPAGGNYIGIECDDFTGSIDLHIE